MFGIDVLLSDNPPNRLITLDRGRDLAPVDGRNLFEIRFRQNCAQYADHAVTHAQIRVAIDSGRM